MILGPLLSTSAVRYSKKGQRVIGALGRAAVAEFDVPGKRRRSHRRIEPGGRDAPEPREHIDTVDVRDQYQRVVAPCQVLAAVVEDIERELSRRFGIDGQVPGAGDNGARNRSAVTKERAARKSAMVRLCGRSRQRTRGGHEDQQDHPSQDHGNAMDADCACEAQM